MAVQTRAGRVISEAVKAEGGPEAGSSSGQMQSQAGKTRNFEQAAQEVGEKMQNHPGTITSQDAAYFKSREARAIGQGQPPSDSISTGAQRIASVNEGHTKVSQQNDMDPTTLSAIDRMDNFGKVAQPIAEKMTTEPEKVTMEEGKLLHSREQRAYGQTSKGAMPVKHKVLLPRIRNRGK